MVDPDNIRLSYYALREISLSYEVASLPVLPAFPANFSPVRRGEQENC